MHPVVSRAKSRGFPCQNKLLVVCESGRNSKEMWPRTISLLPVSPGSSRDFISDGAGSGCELGGITFAVRTFLHASYLRTSLFAYFLTCHAQCVWDFAAFKNFPVWLTFSGLCLINVCQNNHHSLTHSLTPPHHRKSTFQCSSVCATLPETSWEDYWLLKVGDFLEVAMVWVVHCVKSTLSSRAWLLPHTTAAVNAELNLLVTSSSLLFPLRTMIKACGLDYKARDYLWNKASLDRLFVLCFSPQTSNRPSDFYCHRILAAGYSSGESIFVLSFFLGCSE